jgi:large subunit ribosomal protein L9
MANVQVILKEKIAKLGAEADIVAVKAGYARNYLIPQGKAYEATAGNLRQIKNLKARRSERETAEKVEAQNSAARLRKQTLKLELATGQGGKAFGAITAADIATAIAEQVKITVDRHQIELEKPIKTTGKHEVTIRLHAEVEAVMKISVATPDAPADADDAGDKAE